MIRMVARALRRTGLLLEKSYWVIPAMRGKCINIGCEKGIRRGWINIDSEIVDPSVMTIDVTTASGLHELYQMAACVIEINDVIDRLNWRQASSLLEACYLILKSSGKIVINFTDESKRIREKQIDFDHRNYKSCSDLEKDLCPSDISDTSQLNIENQTCSTHWTTKKVSYILISMGFSTICIENTHKRIANKKAGTCIVAYKAALY